MTDDTPKDDIPFKGYHDPREAKGPIDKRLDSLIEDEKALDRAFRKGSEASFRMFYRGLTVPSDTGPRVFEGVMAPFQRDFFEDVADALEASRDGKMPKRRRFWLERTKKASKDADLAVIVLWLCAFPKRPYYGQIGAGNQKQAAVVRERVEHLLHHNPWLIDHVELIKDTIRSKKLSMAGKSLCEVDIMAADSKGSHGGTPDLMLINELTHITKWEFAETLMGNAAGVPSGIVIIATNAGFKGSDAEKWRKNAIKSVAPANATTSGDETGLFWWVHIWGKPAPWHSSSSVKDEEKLMSKSRFLRLWHGVWVTNLGDAVEDDVIDRAFRLDGPTPPYTISGNWGNDRPIFVAGMDLAVNNDHCGVVVVGVHVGSRRVKLYWGNRYMANPTTGEVDLLQVQSDFTEMCKRYRVAVMLYDRYQAELMAQQMRREGLNCVAMGFNNTNMVRMANAFMQLINSSNLLLYDTPELGLRNDIAKFNIVEKSYGFRLDSVADATGHSDVGTALVLTLPTCLELMETGTNALQPEDSLIYDNEEPMTEEEVKEMPDELRDIYEMDQNIGGSSKDRDDDDNFDFTDY